MSKRRIGVYICHCGGNISDYVDVAQVRDAVADEDEVVVAKTTLFSCSDASQQQMVTDIQELDLDGLVVASCSPMLHLFTFRGVAERAGLNPFQYVQVNVREQCSWTHTDDPRGATDKATRLVRAGISKAARTRPLEPIRVETVPRVLVVGGGLAGLRAALALADLGMGVYLVEREAQLGGRVRELDRIYPHDEEGALLVQGLVDQLRSRENVSIFTQAELVEKRGSIGDFEVEVKVRGGDAEETVHLNVGAIVVATGFRPYQPPEGEYGRGLPGVVTLPEFRELLKQADPDEPLEVDGQPIESVSYIYCVGSRQEEGNSYCSRYCCSAAVHTAKLVADRYPELRQFHLHKGMRAYGKYETLFEDACRSGSVFAQFDVDEPPVVEASEDDEGLSVRVQDLLTDRKELEIQSDLVVLVTGMVPPENQALQDVLKLPLGRDGFYNEIHLKLRPVETVIDGVFLAGTAQGPKTAGESVASAMAAVSKVASLLLKGYVELAPLVASVDPEACSWCDKCFEACTYGAIQRIEDGDRVVARVHETLCKGGGACLPVCPANAIQLEGYTDEQMESMISALAGEVVR